MLVTTGNTQTFDMGDRPTLVATFRTLAGVLDDPTAITFRLMAPDGTVETQDETFATNSSIGVWEWQVPGPLDAPGTWRFHAVATSGMQVAEEIAVKVRKSAFPYPLGS